MNSIYIQGEKSPRFKQETTKENDDTPSVRISSYKGMVEEGWIGQNDTRNYFIHNQKVKRKEKAGKLVDKSQ